MPSHDDIQIHGEHLYSARFDDHYASRQQPQAEKFAVFCEGNHLPARFSAAQTFTIAELGFGSGLGFLVTARLWLASAPPDACLEYFSVEGYPLSRDQLTQAQQAFPELADLAQSLQQAHPGEIRGFHRLNLFNERIRLTLMHCDVNEALAQMQATVDAWYLDGFAPSKNPQMWQPAIFREMNRLSSHGTTFATYTAAGQVRRDLQASGFAVQRVPGYGLKRERLVGQFAQSLRTRAPFPWRARPSAVDAGQSITLIGGGIAGCALANRLAARGRRVTIIEAETQLAGGASANPVAIGQPALTRDQNLTSQLGLQGFLYTRQTLDRLKAKQLDPGFHPCGSVVVAKSDWDRQRQQDVAAHNPPAQSLAQWQSAAELSQHSGACLTSHGWLFPQAGWVSLARWCHALVAEYRAQVTVRTSLPVAAIEFRQQQWQCLNAAGDTLALARHLVLTNGFVMQDFQPAAYLPLRANRGQVVYVESPGHNLNCVVRAEGYSVPLDPDFLCQGSSYDMDNRHAELSTADRLGNLEQLANRLPAASETIQPESSLDWSAVRTALPDRLPVLGQLVRAEAFVAQFEPMFRGEVQHSAVAVPWQPGLYAYTGLGSHSVIYCMIAAEALAAELCGEPSPLPRRLRDALDVNRFLLRKARS